MCGLLGGVPAHPTPHGPPPAGEPCPEPTIVPSYYTTSDAVISSESVFVVEISLACKNGAQVSPRGGAWGDAAAAPPRLTAASSPQNVALYADVNGKQFPVTRGQDVGRYQVRLGRAPGGTLGGSGGSALSPLPSPPQVSWSLEHRSAQSGTYEVKFFDEESYSALRKVGPPLPADGVFLWGHPRVPPARL